MMPIRFYTPLTDPLCYQFGTQYLPEQGTIASPGISPEILSWQHPPLSGLGPTGVFRPPMTTAARYDILHPVLRDWLFAPPGETPAEMMEDIHTKLFPRLSYRTLDRWLQTDTIIYDRKADRLIIPRAFDPADLSTHAGDCLDLAIKTCLLVTRKYRRFADCVSVLTGTEPSFFNSTRWTRHYFVGYRPTRRPDGSEILNTRPRHFTLFDPTFQKTGKTGRLGYQITGTVDEIPRSGDLHLERFPARYPLMMLSPSCLLSLSWDRVNQNSFALIISVEYSGLPRAMEWACLDQAHELIQKHPQISDILGTLHNIQNHLQENALIIA